MTLGSWRDRIPEKVKGLAGVCVLCVLIVALVLLSGYLSGLVHVPPANATVHVQILEVNDFHGHMAAGQIMNNRPVGSAPVLASYLKAAMASGNADGTIIALPGDVIGSAPPVSGLLMDEPSMLFFNSFANQYCTVGSNAPGVSCNMVATLGNQEFNNGVPEVLRMINGGNGATNITHIVDPYPGTKIDYVSSNVVWTANNTTVLPPYTLRTVDGVTIAFIGADTIKTPTLTTSANVANLTFQDEADSINQYIPEIQAKGVHAIVVLLHEGGTQVPYEGPTQENATMQDAGRVVGIVSRLDPAVDVVLSAHTHEFTNIFLPDSTGKLVLVTQAYMYGRGYGDIDLTIDRSTGEIVGKSAQIVPTYADQAPGTSLDPAATALLSKAQNAVNPVEDQVIGTAAENITIAQNSAGESAMGDLVADEERATMKTDVAFDTSGDVFANISKGTITWMDLYNVQPNSGTLMAMTMSGAQIRQTLEQQWQAPLPTSNLVVSGLSYTWDAAQPAGSKVTSVSVNGVPLNPNATYTVATVDTVTLGYDGYTTFMQGGNMSYGPTDIDALVSYVGSLPQPVNVTVDGRIHRVN
ncbi:MAG: bifunctional metallophosphatase/5'-nucleotidase [Methanoregula sp.]|uniref:bifunctional metallophosphatase/5'-nucleotidase n=1 Tax=Methanoregula sp. TaxID=2052170 RepID=UPI003C707D7C